MSLKIRNKGFSLVEVLVALLIMSAGVVGVVALQSNLMKTEKSVDLRQFALQLGQAKLEDLRAFIDVESKTGQFDYNDIANNTGGALAAGDVQVQVSTATGDLHTFNRSWQITNQYFVDTTGDGLQDSWVEATHASAPSPLPAAPAQKMMSVVVSWTDIDNSAKQVTINGSLAPIPAGRSFQAMNESDNAKAGPVVSYTPGEAPDVVSYELGNGEKVETSKPLPEIRNNGNNTVVNFETVRYIQDADGTDRLEQEDFATLNCACRLAGTGQGKTASMTVLQGDELVTELGYFITKTIGEPANNRQEPLCDVCCRDHHDTNNMISDEVHFRSEAGAPHSHFKNVSGLLVPALLTGSEYDEICRFKRVDGLFELYPDWELVDLIEFSDQYLFDTATLEAYVNYSEALVSSSIDGTSAPTPPSDRDREVRPGGYQYVARGIYVDRVKAEHKAEIIERLENGDATWKAITPFYDVNLTLLADWSIVNSRPDVPLATVAEVTQEDIQSIIDPAQNYYGTYSRGRLEALTDGLVNIQVAAFKGNAGIIGGDAVSSITLLQRASDDEVEITVDAQANSEKFFAIIGNVSCLISIDGVQEACETNASGKSSYVDLTSMTIVEDPSRFDCSITVPNGNKATPFYSCDTVPANWVGTIQFSISVPGATATVTIQYPDKVDNTGLLNLDTPLTTTSNGDYNVIINVVK